MGYRTHYSNAGFLKDYSACFLLGWCPTGCRQDWFPLLPIQCLMIALCVRPTECLACQVRRDCVIIIVSSAIWFHAIKSLRKADRQVLPPQILKPPIVPRGMNNDAYFNHSPKMYMLVVALLL